MVGECYARITRGNPYAYVVVLVLLLLPMVGWGQNVCPTISNPISSNAGDVAIASNGYGVPSPSSIAIGGSLTIKKNVTFAVSGTLEIAGSLVIEDGAIFTICQTGKVVVKGGLTLGMKSDLIVQGYTDPLDPANAMGGAIVVLGTVSADNNGNVILQNGGNLIFTGTTGKTGKLEGTGDFYIFDDDPNAFANLINDPDAYELFQQNTCPTASPVTLTVSPGYNIASGTPVTITALSATTFDIYSFYIVGNAAASQSTGSNEFAINTLVNGSKVSVLAKITSSGCLKTATTDVFTVSTPPATPTTPTGTTPICQGTTTSTVQTTATSGASTYTWSIVPQSGATSPGSISDTGTTATITWNPSFSGVALVTVAGVSSSGLSGTPSAALGITVNPKPAPALASIITCAGQAPTLGLTAAFDSYSWNVTTTNFGIVSGADTALPVLGTPDNDMLFPIGTFDIVAYPEVSVTVTSGGCSATVTNNSTDKKIAVHRIPRTGTPYHIANNVAQ